jgi:hypothetical protein
MKIPLAAVITLVIVDGALTQAPSQKGDDKPVRQVVQRFYDTFNSHDWGRADEFTTEDWTHIDPGGGWTRGRKAVVKLLKEVHSTFLKGVDNGQASYCEPWLYGLGHSAALAVDCNALRYCSVSVFRALWLSACARMSK